MRKFVKVHNKSSCTIGGRKVGTVKNEVIKIIQSLPEDCTLEEIQYHLYVREKVERGMKAIDEGQVVSQAEAEDEVKGWLK
jgi:predicted transcriptional regulator